MKRGVSICLVGLVAVFLSSCGSNKAKDEFDLIPEGARQVDMGSKYDYRGQVQRGKNGEITGGKRSQYDRAASTKFNKDFATPEYLKKDFHQTAWTGSKDFKSGSYQGLKSAAEATSQSRFDGTVAKQAGQQSRAQGQGFETGSYATSGAREAQKANIQAGTPDAVAHRERVWGWEPEIYSKDEYRRMTVRETRSLMGRGN